MSKTIHKLKCSACGHLTNTQEVYNQALDDFINVCEEGAFIEDGYGNTTGRRWWYDLEDLRNFAEELKKGGKNGK